MAGADPVTEQIRARLQEAIDTLRIDLARVEIWANALEGFSRPVPTYGPESRLLRFPKTRKAPRKER